MALIDRPEKKAPTVKESASVDRDLILKKKTLSAVERKNIKVSPESLELIKTLSLMQSVKHYEMVDELLEHYINTKMTDREKRMIKNITDR